MAGGGALPRMQGMGVQHLQGMDAAETSLLSPGWSSLVVCRSSSGTAAQTHVRSSEPKEGISSLRTRSADRPCARVAVLVMLSSAKSCRCCSAVFPDSAGSFVPTDSSPTCSQSPSGGHSLSLSLFWSKGAQLVGTMQLC